MKVFIRLPDKPRRIGGIETGRIAVIGEMHCVTHGSALSWNFVMRLPLVVHPNWDIERDAQMTIPMLTLPIVNIVIDRSRHLPEYELAFDATGVSRADLLKVRQFEERMF